MESGWNVLVWLVGVVSRMWVWLYSGSGWNVWVWLQGRMQHLAKGGSFFCFAREILNSQSQTTPISGGM